MGDAAKGNEHERRIVEIGIEVVPELEGPAAGLYTGVVHLPVARTENLLIEQPVGSLHQRGRIGAQARLLQRHHGDGGVPDRRDAGLNSHRVVVFDRQPRQSVDRPLELRVPRLMPEREQRIHRVHHRRVNRSQAVAAIEMVEHPPARRADRAAAERLPGRALVQLHQPIEQQKQIVPADQRSVPLERPGARRRIAKELVHVRSRDDQA